MSSHELATKSNLRLTIETKTDQYTLGQIFGIWLAASAPMWLLGWVIYPALSAGLSQMDAGLLRMKLMAGGLVWQFLLSMLILFAEQGNLGLKTISSRFWLNHPKSFQTGETKKVLWWWIIPLFLLVAALEMGLRPKLVELWTGIFPFFAEPKGYDMSVLFSPELRALWVGAWGFLGLFFVLGTFNTFLGEEFLFRGVLLPKMEGVFGKWDWMANGVMFGLYHLHQPWGILSNIVFGVIVAFCGKRFHSNWFPIILHSGQTVIVLVMILGLVLGLV